METHVVEAGECVTSLAARHGLRWQDVWELPENEGLRASRRDPNLLREGDHVALPDVQPGSARVATNRRHTFVLEGEARLRLRLQLAGEPLAGEPYRLTVGERVVEGRTDAEALLDERIAATATAATLLLVDRARQVELAVGALGPADTPTGASARLQNLGLAVDRVHALTPALRRALRALQRLEGLDPTGALDAATVEALVRRHDGSATSGGDAPAGDEGAEGAEDAEGERGAEDGAEDASAEPLGTRAVARVRPGAELLCTLDVARPLAFSN